MHIEPENLMPTDGAIITKKLVASGAAFGFVSGLGFRLADKESRAFECLCDILNISDNFRSLIDAVNSLAASARTVDIAVAEVINSLSTGTLFAAFGAIAGVGFAYSAKKRQEESHF
ncbi:MAG: hypothetical protein US89_C0007G0020 [Candidatus Peregrinibacteria bacterium GW2011_GWF2_38_29]|nr:MAG: hypothetical protein US89_C0007G0020 [Candidatus Peregrinibacteria bacterium GW2011_GWF2_38_29]HBB02837.1 hypothetical protein [Candidatus Peregrinibacteria bacterium]